MKEKQELVRKFLQKYSNQKSHKVVMDKVINNVIKNKTLSEAQLNKLQLKLQELPQIPQTTRISNESKSKSQELFFEPFTKQQTENKFFLSTNPYKIVKQEIAEESERSKKSVYFADEGNQDEWAALAKYDAELHKQEIFKKKEKERINQSKLKEVLDKQVKEKYDKKLSEKEWDHQYCLDQNQQRELYFQEEMNKKLRMSQKIHTLQQEINQQVRIKKKSMNDFLKKEKLDKEKLTKQFEQDMTEELEKQLFRKQKERDFLQNEMKKAQEIKLKQELERKKKKELEMNQDQFGQILDQLEEKRQNEKKKRDDKIHKLLHRWDGYNFVKAEEALYKSEHDRYQYWKSVEDQKHQEREQKYRYHKHQMKLETIQALEKQVEINKQKEEQEKQIDRQKNYLKICAKYLREYLER